MPSAPTTFKPAIGNSSAVVTHGKRAFSYLRVSSDGQVKTDYDPDGLSIAAQREAAEDKAQSLTAEIDREFSTQAARRLSICTSVPAF